MENKAIFISINSMLKNSKDGMISKSFVNQINKLIEETKSELILTDTSEEIERLDKSVEYLFKKNGFRKEPKIRVSSIGNKKDQRLEHFFLEHELYKFIIIDCEKLLNFRARFIHCSDELAMPEKLYNTALALLN